MIGHVEEMEFWWDPSFHACLENPTFLALAARLCSNSPMSGGRDVVRGWSLTTWGFEVSELKGLNVGLPAAIMAAL